MTHRRHRDPWRRSTRWTARAPRLRPVQGGARRPDRELPPSDQRRNRRGARTACRPRWERSRRTTRSCETSASSCRRMWRGCSGRSGTFRCWPSRSSRIPDRFRSAVTACGLSYIAIRAFDDVIDDHFNYKGKRDTLPRHGERDATRTHSGARGLSTLAAPAPVLRRASSRLAGAATQTAAATLTGVLGSLRRAVIGAMMEYTPEPRLSNDDYVRMVRLKNVDYWRALYSALDPEFTSPLYPFLVQYYEVAQYLNDVEDYDDDVLRGQPNLLAIRNGSSHLRAVDDPRPWAVTPAVEAMLADARPRAGVGRARELPRPSGTSPRRSWPTCSTPRAPQGSSRDSAGRQRGGPRPAAVAELFAFSELADVIEQVGRHADRRRRLRGVRRRRSRTSSFASRASASTAAARAATSTSARGSPPEVQEQARHRSATATGVRQVPRGAAHLRRAHLRPPAQAHCGAAAPRHRLRTRLPAADGAGLRVRGLWHRQLRLDGRAAAAAVRRPRGAGRRRARPVAVGPRSTSSSSARARAPGRSGRCAGRGRVGDERRADGSTSRCRTSTRWTSRSSASGGTS